MRSEAKIEIGCWAIPVLTFFLLGLTFVVLRIIWVEPQQLCTGFGCEHPSKIAAMSEFLAALLGGSLLFFGPIYILALLLRLAVVAISKVASSLERKKGH